MRTIYKLALAGTALGLGFATPAEAAATLGLCPGGSSCVSGTTNVNLVASTDVTTVVGNVGVGGPEVDFTSTDGNLDGVTGDAKISRHDGLDMTQITFTLLTGAFTAAEFNFEQGTPKEFDVVLSALGGGSQTIHVDNALGSNVFFILAGAGESYTSASINSTGGAVDGAFKDFKQLHLTLEGQPRAVVPEPGTWGLMLLGFGGIGMALRRSRRRNPALLQIA